MPTIIDSHRNHTIVVPATARRSRPTNRRRKPAVAFAARYRNRPTLIRQAIYRVWVVAEQIGGTKSTIALLQAIVSCVSKDAPFDPVFAKKEKLATIAEISEASVYRGLNVLKEGGWIDKLDQHRHLDGTLDIGELKITAKLAELLGVVVPPLSTSTGNCEQPVESPSGSSESSSGSHQVEVVSAEKTPLPTTWTDDDLTGKSPEMRDGLRVGSYIDVDLGVHPKASVNYQSTDARYVRMDGRSVPVELAWLISESRLRYGQLFKLMKLAKQVAGQKLSDFIALRGDRLKQLNSTNDCYRYLKNLIDQGIDAKFLAANNRKAEHRVARKAQCAEAAEKRNRWIRLHDGKMFKDAQTGRIYSVSAAGSHAHACNEQGDLTNATHKITGRFISLVEGGRLQPFSRTVVTVDAGMVVERAGSLLKMLRMGRFENA